MQLTPTRAETAAFRDRVHAICGPLDFEGDTGTPGALETAELEGCRVSRLRAGPHRMHAPRQRLQGGHERAVKLLFQIAGTQSLATGAGRQELRAGQWAVFDPVQEYAASCETPICQLLVEIPRDSFSPQLLARLSAPRIYPNSTLCRPMALLIDSALTPTRGGADPLAGELGLAVLAMSEPFRRLVSTDFGYAETGDTVLRDRFAACVERRLHDPELGIDEIARKLGCSRRRLYSAFERAQTSPGQQLRDQRLARAHAALTRDGAHSVAEVAFACGFRSAPHFTRAFKARYGCPPAALRALRSATRD